MEHRLLFGPIPSRRLGLSLGVDLVPYKACSMNCVYCECDETTIFTLERQEFFPTQEILDELDQYLKKSPKLDYVTLTGSGEPTLNKSLGRIISFLKKNYPQYKICVITNSTLFWRKDVRQEIMNVDLVMPSLDAMSEKAFVGVTRPHGDLSFDQMLEGMLQFSKEFTGELWLEVFVVKGINDNFEEMSKVAAFAKKMNPSFVQINALDRPGTEAWVEKPDREIMEEICELFAPLNAQIISKYEARDAQEIEEDQLEQMLIDTLSRRPCTISDLEQVTGIDAERIQEKIDQLVDQKAIVLKKQARGNFYFLKSS